MAKRKWYRRRLRYFLKTLTYKTLSLLITIGAGWIITGNIAVGLSLGVIEITLKLGVYYAHEEVWYYFRNRKRKKHSKKNK